MPDGVTTPDLYFAAYLSAKGFPRIGAHKNGARVHFEFGGGVDLANAYRNYLARDPVPAIDYADAVRSLKALLHGV